jgi:hypothetical protein
VIFAGTGDSLPEPRQDRGRFSTLSRSPPWIVAGHWRPDRWLTIDLWPDSRGRPTGITATGTARSERVRVTESFTRYDKPITITAPKTTASAITESADTAQPGRPAWPSVPTP